MNELYQETLLQHSRRPKNHGPLPDATHRAEGYNALCGDEITVELAIDDGAIRAAHFTSSACAICTASASIMTGEITGLPVCEAVGLAGEFRQFATDGEIRGAVVGRPRLEVMGTVHHFPQRVKCATLPWETFVAATKTG